MKNLVHQYRTPADPEAAKLLASLGDAGVNSCNAKTISALLEELQTAGSVTLDRFMAIYNQAYLETLKEVRAAIALDEAGVPERPPGKVN